MTQGLMRFVLIAVSLRRTTSLAFTAALLLACGGSEGPAGPQGPEGPRGPPGMGGGGSITFASAPMPANHFVTDVTGWTFDLATQEPALPAAATAVYVELNGCRLAPSAPALVRFKTAASTTTWIRSTEDCASAFNTATTAKQVWMPSTAPHRITVEALHVSTIGSASASSSVVVLGWYVP